MYGDCYTVSRNRSHMTCAVPVQSLFLHQCDVQIRGGIFIVAQAIKLNQFLQNGQPGEDMIPSIMSEENRIKKSNSSAKRT